MILGGAPVARAQNLAATQNPFSRPIKTTFLPADYKIAEWRYYYK
jgi:hypothetical protein